MRPTAVLNVVGLTRALMGADTVTATNRTYAALFGMLSRQAAMVSFVGLFQLLGIVFLVIIPLVLLMKRPGHGGPAMGAH